MTKITLALAAALLAGTTMTSVANADAVRVGFGFPLGSFVAHSNENYAERENRNVERPRYARRDYREDVAPRKVVKVKQVSRSEVAEAAVSTPAVKTAKFAGNLASDPATTTVIEKTALAKGDAAQANTLTTGSVSPIETKTAVNSENNSNADTVAAKADAQTAPAEQATEHVCRRYSPAIAALIDVPCE